MAKRPTPAPAPTDVQLAIPLPTGATAAGSEKWWSEEIEQAQKRRKKELPLWRANLDRYRGEKPKLTGLNARDVMPVNVDFEKVEAKKSQLFFQQPDIMLEPRDGQNKEVAALFRDVINYYLGTEEANVLSMVDEVMLDLLCPAGLGPTKIGFEEVKLPVQVPVNDPTTGQPAVDPTGKPQTQTVSKRVYARYFWERISPARLLIPKGFKSQNFDRADWLGFEYDLTESEKKHANTAGPGPIGEDESLSPPNDKDGAGDRPDRAIEIWYRASAFDDTVTDPRRYRRLVMTMQGKRDSRVTVHEDSPYQTLTPEGAFLAGMLGNPIHILTLRPMTDTAYVPSDSTVSRGQVDELSTGRSQMILQRKRNLPMRGVDRGKVDKKVLDALERGEVQSVIGVDGDPDQVIKVIASANLPQEDFTFNNIVSQDIDRLWALGANASGTLAARQATATESANMQRGTDNRLVKERNRVMTWYVKGVEKFSSLLQLFGDEATVVPITGQQSAQVFQSWDRTKTPGRYMFRIRPDSSVRVDAAEDLDRLLRAYNLLAKDPHVNRVELLSAIVVKFGLDPQKVIVAQLPPPSPEPPKPTISLKAEDLGNPLVIQLLAQFGIKLTPPPPPEPVPLPGQAPAAAAAVAPAAAPAAPPAGVVLPSPAHPGGAERMQPIDQHEADRTGRRSGPGPTRAH
jgi:hypothetical protein